MEMTLVAYLGIAQMKDMKGLVLVRGQRLLLFQFLAHDQTIFHAIPSSY